MKVYVAYCSVIGGNLYQDTMHCIGVFESKEDAEKTVKLQIAETIEAIKKRGHISSIPDEIDNKIEGCYMLGFYEYSGIGAATHTYAIQEKSIIQATHKYSLWTS